MAVLQHEAVLIFGNQLSTEELLKKYPEKLVITQGSRGVSVRQAYRLYSGGQGRSSWDLCTVQWTMGEERNLYAKSAPGRITIDERWESEEENR